MADINMFDLARKLIPDIEENMPAAVREAFEAGQVKEIFRTGSHAPKGSTIRGASTAPGSFYFRLDDGRTARYGRHGEGWMGDRASTSAAGMHALTQDDPFHFDRTLFHEAKAEHARIGDSSDVLKDPKYSLDLVVGKQLLETKEEFGKIVNIHGADVVTDFYTREGKASFVEDIGSLSRSGRCENSRYFNRRIRFCFS